MWDLYPFSGFFHWRCISSPSSSPLRGGFARHRREYRVCYPSSCLPCFRTGRTERPSFAIPALLAGALLLIWLAFRITHLDSETEAIALVHTALLFIGYKLKTHAQRFAWSFAVLIGAYALILPGYIEGANRIYVGRNFFCV